jgi:DNA helicase-2/ATP-dependent DNA helicase PcrA
LPKRCRTVPQAPNSAQNGSNNNRMSSRWQYIRAKAAAVRRYYAVETGQPVPLHLPVEDLAEQLYLLSAFEDPTLDPRINGELNPATDSIRLRPGLHPNRQRFIIAHELGHYVLEGAAHGIFQDDDTTIDERAGGEIDNEAGVLRAYNTRERQEQEANLFALELLIPADVLWEAVQQPAWTTEELARQFGVSIDALYTQLLNVCCLEPVQQSIATAVHLRRTITPDPQQHAAVDAPLPTLVMAGPGTGKTRSIVAKHLALVESGVDPASILALTFSNKAAEEMRQRIIAALNLEHAHLAGRIEVSTFHAWGLNFLRTYGHHMGLPLDVQLRAPGDLFVLLKRRLVELSLDHYKSLHNPSHYLSQIMQHISRAKDELRPPAEYRQLAEAEAERLLAEAEQAYAGKTTQTAQKARERAIQDAARLRELATIYEEYQRLLRSEGVLDYGDLIMQAVEALRIPAVAAEIKRRYQYILVDEFQDINYASGTLVALLDGGRGRVWAVGDPWQSIYRFRGASAANIQQFDQVYPTATTVPLVRNYRSIQPILDASHAVMEADADAGTRMPQQAQRQTLAGQRGVAEWVAEDEASEHAAIAHDILRRVGRRTCRLQRCADLRSGAHIRRGRPSPMRFQKRRWRFADHVILCRTHSQAARIASVLEAHGIPIDGGGDIYAYPEVKDVLAICGLVRSLSDAGFLRTLTMPEHALSHGDFATLVRLAHKQKSSLPQVASDETSVAQLSPAGQAVLQTLNRLRETLASEPDAWRVLTRYLFAHSRAMRARLCRAASGDYMARRALAMLGQLALVARNFVRQALPGQENAAAFLAYVRTLIEAGETPKAEALPDGANVVRVMTVHAAKGLEFPILYLPGLGEGQFPSKPRSTSIPALPGLVHGSLGDERQEERYLLYVAMTRAQDRLILSRSATRKGKPFPRSSLLPGGPEGATAPWPIRTVPPIRRCPPTSQPVRLLSAPVIRTPIPASSLETYETCPRRYLYQYGYQLYDDAAPYLRMHQTIRNAVTEVTRLARDGSLPPDEAALHDLVWQIFASHTMAEVLYAHDYFQEAFRHVRQIWQDLSAGAVTPDTVDRTFLVQRPHGTISVTVDRIEQGPNEPRWIRLRSGRERDDDHLDTRIMLYALASTEQYGQAGELAIHYTANGTHKPVKLRSDVLERHTSKIDETLAGMAGQQWEPKVGPQCDICPFNVICPV